MDVNSNNKSGSDEQMMDILLVLDKEKKLSVLLKALMKTGNCKPFRPIKNTTTIS